MVVAKSLKSSLLCQSHRRYIQPKSSTCAGVFISPKSSTCAPKSLSTNQQNHPLVQVLETLQSHLPVLVPVFSKVVHLCRCRSWTKCVKSRIFCAKVVVAITAKIIYLCRCCLFLQSHLLVLVLGIPQSHPLAVTLPAMVLPKLSQSRQLVQVLDIQQNHQLVLRFYSVRQSHLLLLYQFHQNHQLVIFPVLVFAGGGSGAVISGSWCSVLLRSLCVLVQYSPGALKSSLEEAVALFISIGRLALGGLWCSLWRLKLVVHMHHQRLQERLLVELQVEVLVLLLCNIFAICLSKVHFWIFWYRS